jgi:hypothetical protein
MKASQAPAFLKRPVVFRSALKVLSVSGYAENATFRDDFLGPDMDMLTKPFALDAVGAKVRMLVEQ